MDPARVQGFEVQTRFGTRLQSYIRPACRASDEALGLDGFPRASSYQSGGLGRPWLLTELGSAGPTGSPSASHNAPYATSARAVFSIVPQSLTTRSFALRALLTASGEPGRKTADAVLLGAR